MKRVKQKLAVMAAVLLLVVAVADPVTAVIWELDCDSGAVFTWQAIVTDSVGDPIPSGDYELIYCYYEDSAGFNLIGCCTTTATVGTPSPGSKDDKAAFSGSALAELTYAQPIWEDTTKVGHFPKMTVLPEIWLELTFNGETMSPMTLVTSVPNSGTAQRVLGDIYTAPGRALIVEPPQASSGMVDLLGNDTVASVALYRPTDDILPMIIMEVTDTTSTLTVFDTSRNTTVSVTGDGAGTFDGLVWSKTGFKFPDSTIQTTAWTGGAGCWVCPANYTYLADGNDSVGIGTSTPSEKLEVSGNLRVTGKAMIGFSHTSTGAFTFVAGSGNTVSGAISTVSGGQNNTASGERSFVGGGSSNCASGGLSFVGGGEADTASGFKSTIGGGQVNTASEFASTVSGGSDNTANGYAGTVSGGTQNVASGMYSTLGGGNADTASGNYSTVGGGRLNVSDTSYSTVSGGDGNNASGFGSTVGGGGGNVADNVYSTVSGGWGNTASDYASTVGGGYGNTASGHASTVAGGLVNTASNTYSTVGGGGGNTANGYSSTVVGGYNSKNAGDYSAIPGGHDDTLTSSADYSMAFGRLVYVNSAYRVVFFGSSYSGRLGINRDDHNGGINYPIHVGTSTSNGNGAYLTNGGTWTNGSSREFKEDFQQLDGKEVLKLIEDLPMESWEYKGTGERHIWPCAEDFHEAFDVGVLKEDGTRDTKYLAAGDVAGVALAGVKQLAKENQELRERIVQLEALVETLLAQQDGSNEPKAEFGMNK